jgi:hypothetical protein
MRAAGYVTSATGARFIATAATASLPRTDGVFADGTQIDLTKEWSVGGEYEHY